MGYRKINIYDILKPSITHSLKSANIIFGWYISHALSYLLLSLVHLSANTFLMSLLLGGRLYWGAAGCCTHLKASSLTPARGDSSCDQTTISGHLIYCPVIMTHLVTSIVAARCRNLLTLIWNISGTNNNHRCF